MANSKKSRREFLQNMAQVSSLMLMNPWDLLRNRAWAQEKNGLSGSERLSARAYRDIRWEGEWVARSIEGKIPSALNGILYRIGPGQKINHGVKLNHFFDGDAYLSALHIQGKQEGLLKGRSRFVETPERVKETQRGEMLYHDYGTAAPKGHGFKICPNVNVIPWRGDLLTLSEGDHPFAVRASDLGPVGKHDFNGTLSFFDSFSAHPRRDPVTGDWYNFGISKGISPALKVFRMKANKGNLELISSYKLGGFYPIHDMTMSRHYIIFVVSPVKIDLVGAALGRRPLAQLMHYDSNQPLRIVIFRKDGVGEPLVIESEPSGMVFHHCNAYEDAEGRLIFNSVVMNNDAAYDVFQSWGSPRMSAGPQTAITRFEVDLASGQLVSRTPLKDCLPGDFPCVDIRRAGLPVQYIHILEATDVSGDPLRMNGLACHDLKENRVRRISAEEGHVWGEPVFVPDPTGTSEAETEGWILHLGYDNSKDETYLEIRTPVTLESVARVWFGHYFPLGFHGIFVNGLS